MKSENESSYCQKSGVIALVPDFVEADFQTLPGGLRPSMSPPASEQTTGEAARRCAKIKS
jgi:hypothetical protein